MNTAELCQSIYNPVEKGVFDVILSNDAVTCGVRVVADVTYIAFAGSEDVTDWMNDIYAVPYNHPKLGYIHRGMFNGMPNIMRKLKPYLKGALVLTGHSLGCSHACFVAALCRSEVAELHLYAPPRAGFKPFCDVVTAKVKIIKAYHNGRDIVPLVPTMLEWCDVAPLIELHAPPRWWWRWSLIRWHAVRLYVKGLRSNSG